MSIHVKITQPIILSGKPKARPRSKRARLKSGIQRINARAEIGRPEQTSPAEGDNAQYHERRAGAAESLRLGNNLEGLPTPAAVKDTSVPSLHRQTSMHGRSDGDCTLQIVESRADDFVVGQNMLSLPQQSLLKSTAATAAGHIPILSPSASSPLALADDSRR